MFKDLILIILGAGISSAYFIFQEYRRKQQEKQQERLNAIKAN
jgi:preprotein translocase subunit YajC